MRKRTALLLALIGLLLGAAVVAGVLGIRGLAILESGHPFKRY